jgi:hypothetical protein
MADEVKMRFKFKFVSKDYVKKRNAFGYSTDFRMFLLSRSIVLKKIKIPGFVVYFQTEQLLNKTLLLYQFTKMVTKLNVIIIMEYHCYQLHTKLYRISHSQNLNPCIDEIIRDHHCGFRRNRLTTDQIFCIRQILEKNCKWESRSAIHRLQESLWFSEEGSTVKYSHTIWGTHETSYVD